MGSIDIVNAQFAKPETNKPGVKETLRVGLALGANVVVLGVNAVGALVELTSGATSTAKEKLASLGKKTISLADQSLAVLGGDSNAMQVPAPFLLPDVDRPQKPETPSINQLQQGRKI